jgi:two-component system CheB/CheR fusion protein
MSDASPHTNEQPPAARPTVVGIGASAGGLHALKRFFSTVEPHDDIAYVVVVHLAAEQKSHLADVLQPHVPIPVLQVTETTPLEANHVYVIPPASNISAVDSHLRLSALEERGRDRAPVDHFFNTLADSHDGHAVAVILSGTGSDGAHGVRRVRQKGGIVLVQDPSQAEFDGMPRNAIATGVADLVLPAEEMPARIREFVRTQPDITLGTNRLPETERDRVPRVLAQVRARTGHDFSRYKRSTIERRIERRMQLRGIEQLDSYLDLLRDHAEEAGSLADDLLINVTRFFRDRSVFDHLEQRVIPELFAHKEGDGRIRVWSVGCSTGEEAYSMGILLLEEAARRGEVPQIQLFASDMHHPSLRFAREGLYPETIEADVSPERLERFFHRENHGYRVRKDLREMIVFAPHNLLRDPPFSHLDFIACRNLLIYLQRDVQEEVIELFHYALQGEGYLLVGTAETVERSELFRLESKEHHVYRRRNVHRGDMRVPIISLASAPAAPMLALQNTPPRATPTVGYGELHEKMVERYAPPSILVNQEHAVLHVSANAGRYLHVSGVPSSNIFRLVKEELRVELRAALHLARDRQTTSRSKPIPMTIDGVTRNVTLRVSPTGAADVEGLVLIIFDETVESQGDDGSLTSDLTVRELEAELDMTKSRLQGLVEEFETSQEEMRASNEELQSANEELRSTMEELETSKEELQSINEELQTVNQENRHRVEELAQLSSDLQNLFKATDIATLFLDRNMRILRFTPRVGELFNVRHTDRGRPLADLTHRLGYSGLLDDAKNVLETLVRIEREVESEDGRWHLIRVLPYRTVEDRIEGVVITIVDVTRLKQSVADARRFNALAESSGEFIGMSDLSLTPFYINRAGLRLVGLDGIEQATHASVLDFFFPDDRVFLEQEFFPRVLREGRGETEIRFRHFRTHEPIWVIYSVVTLTDETGSAVGFGTVTHDITERKQAEQALAASEQRFRALVTATSYIVFRMSPDWSEVRELTGRAPLTNPVRASRAWLDEYVHPDDHRAVWSTIEDAIRHRRMLEVEHRAATSDDDVAWILTRAVPLLNGTGEIVEWFGAATDVTARKEAEAALQELNVTLERRVHERTAAIERLDDARRRVLLQLVSAEEDERARISRELHDQLGQQLTALLLGLRALRTEGTTNGALSVEQLEQLTSGIARDVHTLALELRPPALDALGLVAAIESHLQEWAQRNDLEYDLHARGLDGARLPAEVETTLYRVVQEALTNVVKHASATRVSVLIERRDDTMRLVLEDDGAGFDVEHVFDLPGKAKRLGLRGMYERVALLGGELDIESTEDGTTVYVRVPVESGVAHE